MRLYGTMLIAGNFYFLFFMSTFYHIVLLLFILDLTSFLALKFLSSYLIEMSVGRSIGPAGQPAGHSLTHLLT